MTFEMTLPYDVADDAQPADLQTHFEVQQFLFAEAKLLDERGFRQWLALLAEDLHYYMPTRYLRLPSERHLEFASPLQSAHFDDDKARMTIRVKRLYTDKAWSEDAPSRTRHLISNVIVADTGDGYQVDSAFLLYRGRQSESVEIFAGARHDRLRRNDSNGFGFEIAKRTILLDQTTILANNLGVFF